jgi:hypothetical protein
MLVLRRRLWVALLVIFVLVFVSQPHLVVGEEFDIVAVDDDYDELEEMDELDEMDDFDDAYDDEEDELVSITPEVAEELAGRLRGLYAAKKYNAVVDELLNYDGVERYEELGRYLLWSYINLGNWNRVNAIANGYERAAGHDAGLVAYARGLYYMNIKKPNNSKALEFLKKAKSGKSKDVAKAAGDAYLKCMLKAYWYLGLIALVALIPVFGGIKRALGKKKLKKVELDLHEDESPLFGEGHKGMLDAEPAPGVPEPVTPEPEPVMPEPAPVIPEPAPVMPEPAPVMPEPAPVMPELAPVIAEPAPVIAEPEPVIPEPAPVIAEPEPVIPEPAPVIAEPAPVIPEPAPVVPEPAPVVAEPAPVIPEPAPVVAEPAHAIPEPAPMRPMPEVAAALPRVAGVEPSIESVIPKAAPVIEAVEVEKKSIMSMMEEESQLKERVAGLVRLKKAVEVDPEIESIWERLSAKALDKGIEPHARPEAMVDDFFKTKGLEVDTSDLTLDLSEESMREDYVGKLKMLAITDGELRELLAQKNLNHLPAIIEYIMTKPEPARLAFVARALGFYRDAAVIDTLSDLLHHKDDRVALAAIQGLENTGNAEVILLLCPFIRSETPVLAQAARSALTKFGPARIIAVLQELPKAQDEKVREAGVFLLSRMNGTAVEQLLKQMLKDPAESVRCQVILAMSFQKNPVYIEKLREFFKTTIGTDRTLARKAIVYLQGFLHKQP